MPTLVFEVTKQPDGSYYAGCQTKDIFAQAPSRPELEEKIKEAVKEVFFDGAYAYKIRMITVRY